MKIKYEYRIQKTAYLPESPTKMVPIGTFEEHERDGDTCRMTVKLFPNVPPELVKMLEEMPQLIQMREIKLKADSVIMIPDVTDLIV